MRIHPRIYIDLLIILLVLFISYVGYCTLRRRSSKKFIDEMDLSRYTNVTWPRRRIPRLIHQTYRTYTIPTVWNATVQSVMKMNSDEFQYRRWSHADMDRFVRQHEPHFYWKTFIHYRYDIQRIDSFRYVLLFHLGGIYIDMDDACRRPFRELVTTMETLDPYSTHLALFPAGELFGIQNNFMIATAGHPIYKQLIARLNLFNQNFLIYHVTILLSVGPLYVTIQERFFQQTHQHVVRLLDNSLYRSIFWKTKGGTWFHRDTLMILYLYYNRHRILLYCILFVICLTILLIVTVLFRHKRRRSLIFHRICIFNNLKK